MGKKHCTMNIVYTSSFFMFFFATPSHAYTHIVLNETNYHFNVVLSYQSALCRNDNFMLAPQGKKIIKAGICTLSSIGASIPATMTNDKKLNVAQPFSENFIGNGIWAIRPKQNNEMAFEVILLESQYLGQILQASARDVVDSAKSAGSWVSDRFRDTKVTRGPDYAIRKAGLESALALATASLDAAKDITKGSLAAARNVAQQALTTSQQFLQFSETVSAGALRGSADASQGVLEGVKRGTVKALDEAKALITQGPLNWFDINEMKYVGNYKELKQGILGNVSIQAELFGKPVPLSLSIDPTAPNLESLYTKSFKPIIDSLINSIKDEIVKPVQEATRTADASLIDSKKIIAASTQLPTSKQLETTITTALEEADRAEAKLTVDTITIQALLDQTEEKAQKALMKANKA